MVVIVVIVVVVVVDDVVVVVIVVVGVGVIVVVDVYVAVVYLSFLPAQQGSWYRISKKIRVYSENQKTMELLSSSFSFHQKI